MSKPHITRKRLDMFKELRERIGFDLMTDADFVAAAEQLLAAREVINRQGNSIVVMAGEIEDLGDEIDDLNGVLHEAAADCEALGRDRDECLADFRKVLVAAGFDPDAGFRLGDLLGRIKGLRKMALANYDVGLLDPVLAASLVGPVDGLRDDPIPMPEPIARRLSPEEQLDALFRKPGRDE